MFNVGDEVSLIANPDNIGSIQKIIPRGNSTYYTVLINGEKRNFNEDQLELHVPEDDFERLRRGKIGNAHNLRDHLTYIRINGNLDNMLYSMNTTNTDFYAYQYKPVLSFLESPNNGLLIADEVGLGKTIEAGLIWTELRARFEYNRIMVLCPATLKNKWERELKNRFGIKAVQADIRDVKKLFKEQIKGMMDEFTIIASLEGVRPRKGWRDDEALKNDASELARYLDDLKEVADPFIDLLVIDEAHKLRNPESTTSQLGKVLRPFVSNILLLSATPIHLQNYDLFQLLELIDEDTFNRRDIFVDILEANEPLVKAYSTINAYNSKKDDSNETMAEIIYQLNKAVQHPLIRKNRQIRSIIEDINGNYNLNEKTQLISLANRIQSINLLSKVISRTRKREVQENRVERVPSSPQVKTTEYEMRFYNHITSLVQEYAYDNPLMQAFLSVMPQQQISSSMPAALLHWRQLRDANYDLCNDQDEWEDLLSFYEIENHGRLREVGPLTDYIMRHIDEEYSLNELIQNDSKYKTFIETVNRLFDNNPKEKIIVFSFFKGTLRYLNKRLQDDHINSVMVYGGMKNQEELFKIFEDPNGPNILLASEVASEGIDLQFASCMVNYDLPWNPMKIEQRIGRIDRIGQTSDKIIIQNLFYENTIDQRIYDRLYMRLDIFKKSIGDFESILGQKIKELTTDLLNKNLTEEEKDLKLDETGKAIENIRQQNLKLEEEADTLIAHGEYIKDQLSDMETAHRTINSLDIFKYVKSFIDYKYKGSEFVLIDKEKLIYNVNLIEAARRDLKNYIEEKASKKYFTRLSSANRMPIKCQFINKTNISDSENIEIINQFHPLIKFISYKIRQEVEIYYSPIGIRLSSDKFDLLPKGYYVFLINQMEFKGIRDRAILNLQLASYDDYHEIIPPDVAEKTIITASLEGRDMEEIIESIDLDKTVCIANELDLRFIREHEKEKKRIKDENNDRIDIQINSLQMHLDNQLEKLENLYQSYLESGSKMAAPTKGKIDILKANIERKIFKYNAAREMQISFTKVCVGIIEIY